MHQLGVVVGTLLSRRRGSEEEPGVEPAWALTDGRDPVGDVADRAEVEHEAVPLAQPLHRQLAGVHGAAVGVVDRDGATVAPAGEQDSCLLEALAHGGDPERQPAAVDPEARRRGRVVEAVAVGGDRRRPVGIVDATAGEHVHPGREGGRRRTAQHEHLQAIGLAVTDEHDRRGRARRHDVNGWGCAHAPATLVARPAPTAVGHRRSRSRSRRCRRARRRRAASGR